MPAAEDPKVDITLPLQRTWVKASHNKGNSEDTTNTSRFTVVSYNILADHFTPDEYFPYCSREHFRAVQRLPQLLRELDHHGADVMCLQEVDPHIYTDHLEPYLAKKGYHGSYVELGTRNATFVKESRFDIVDIKTVGLPEALAREVQNPTLVENELDSVLVESRPMMFCRLRCRNSGNIVCVGNVHLTFESYKKLDITALEASMVIRSLSKESEGGAHILCGDFNQEPYMPGYQLLHNGQLNDTDKSWLRQFPLDQSKMDSKMNCLVDLIPELFSHKSKHLKSAYKTVVGHEVPFSNHEDASGTMVFNAYTDVVQTNDGLSESADAKEEEVCPTKKKTRPKMYQSKPENYGKEVFIGALDYQWFNSDKLHCVGVLEMVDESKIEQFHSAPNIVFPSDHLLMKAEYEFTS